MVRKINRSTTHPVPKVRIVEPSGRPIQVRYHCPIEKREIRISTGSRDRNVAELLKREIEAKLLLGIEIQSASEKIRGPEMDWKDFREEYRVLHLATVRDKTAQDAESRLDIAERIIKPKSLGKMADTTALQALQVKLLSGEHSRDNRPRSDYTVRGYMKAVLAALNWAYRQDWLEREPKLPRLRISKGSPMKGRPINEAEFKHLLSTVTVVVGAEAAESWKYVLKGLWESALRIEELMNVSWDETGKIRPIWADGKHPVLEIPAEMQKNGTHETIPILPGFEKLLLETPLENRRCWVFDPQSLQMKLGRKVRHQRPNPEWVGRVISKIGKESGIVVAKEDDSKGKVEKYVSAHDLRRSCGEKLRNMGVPPLIISRVMRHSSWETTQKHYAPGNTQSDADLLHKIVNS
ncbi:tyrosine-type recombinase/integrase [Rubinisphaera italica]|uniref:Phage integrase family protein n=1 Tax=Rubinisphaera italica TaxID=2527969 RepID=A0A5C5XEK0_9PLAN|nr:site-specific integrase [Rubinisphaera italica]TWT60841.1 Phage integrase family protein [Rubinisphaera italica]